MHLERGDIVIIQKWRMQLPVVANFNIASALPTSHVETVCLLVTQNAKAKQHVNVGIDAEEYYRIKNS